METEKTYKYRLVIGLLLLIVIPLFALSHVNTTIGENSQELESTKFQYKVDQPNHVELVKYAVANDYRLDSIYTIEKTGEILERRKWFFHYEGNELVQSEKLYFGESFDLKFGQYYTWYYNSNYQLILNEEFNALAEGIDTIIRLNYSQYSYSEELLQKRVEHSTSGYSFSARSNADGIISYEYEPHYNDVEYFYKYTANGLLECNYWGLNYFDNGDSTFSANYYIYNDEGQMTNRLNSKNDMYFRSTAISYVNTENTTHITEKYSYFNPRAALGFSLDTLSEDWINVEYYTEYAANGYDGFYIYSRTYYPKETVFKQKIEFEYNNNHQLSKEVYFLWDTNQREGNWYEQINVNYTYDEIGNLIHYEKTYYDLQYNKWMLLEEHEYFYSKTFRADVASQGIEKNIEVFPNPCNEMLNIKGINNSMNYAIYTLQGSVIQKGNVKSKQISVSNLEQGVYVLELLNAKKKRMIRFLKK